MEVRLNLRKKLYKKKQFLTALQLRAVPLLLRDTIICRWMYLRNRMPTPWQVSSYNISFMGERLIVKSPSRRQLILITTRVLTEHYAKRQLKYFGLIGFDQQSGIIDVGANIGYYSLLYSLLFPEAEIYAFEPSNGNYQYLRYHCENRNNIYCFNLGAHNKIDAATIQMPSFQQSPSRSKAKNNTGLMSMYGDSNKIPEKITLVPLDIFFDRDIFNTRISYIKVDVEGNELPVLQGCRRIIEEHVPVFEVEINKAALKLAGNQYDEIVNFFAEYNYKPYKYDGKKLFEIEKDFQEDIFDATFIKEGQDL